MRKPFIIILIISIFIFGLFIPKELVYDDILLIGHNKTLQNAPSLKQIFSEHLWEGTPQVDEHSGFYYRPLVITSFYIDTLIFGKDYGSYHLQSIFWHILCSVLFWVWIKPYTKSEASRLLAFAIFLLHPVQMESVVFLAARNDSMACAGVLAMLLALRQQHAIFAGLTLLFALLCKESALLLPFVLVFVSWKREAIPKRLWLSLSISIVVYFSMRFFADIAWPNSSGASLPQLATSILIYADHFIFPTLLLPSSHIVWTSTSEFVGGTFGLLVLLAICIPPLPAKRWSLALCIAGIIPSFAAIGKTGLVADRYLYLPMIGLSLLLANFIDYIAQKNKKIQQRGLFLFGIPLCSLYLVHDLRILSAWQDNLTLFETASTVHQSPYQSGAYAKALESVGKLDEAAYWYEQAVQPPLPYTHSCYNITWIHLLRGDMERIVLVGENALKAGCPPSEELTAPLALAHVVAGNWDRALVLTNKSKRDPRNIFFLVRVVLAAHNRDEPAFSIPAYIKAKEDALKILEQSDPESALWLKNLSAIDNHP